jgi:hypothetical protein
MICKFKFNLSVQPWYDSDYYELIEAVNEGPFSSTSKFRNLKTNKISEFFNHYMDDVTNLNETKRYLRDLKINNLLKNG